MTASTLTPRPVAHRLARATGAAYLGIIATGIFAEFVVRMQLVVPDDPVATTANIADASALFRGGLVADLAMVALDVGVAVGLYLLLRHVDRTLALLAAAFRLLQAAVLGANLVNLVAALQSATADGAIGDGTAQWLTHAAMERHGIVYDLGLVFFGLACLVLGHLLVRTRLVPRLVARGLTATGVVYLVGSLAVLLLPDVAATLDPIYGIAVVAELAFAGWLAVKGATHTDPVPA